MSKRTFWVSVAVVAVLGSGVVGIPDSSGSWRGGFGYDPSPPPRTPIHWKVAGTIVYTQLDIPTGADPPIAFVPAVVIDIVAKGAPGDAQIKVIAIAGEVVFPPTEECGDTYPKLLFSQADMVATFADQSMLFATIDKAKGGYLCLEPPPTHDENNMIVTGGTGRFEGAMGSFVGRFLSEPVGTIGALVAEHGTMEGWIER